MRSSDPKLAAWPDLPYGEWQDTCRTLHLWTQIVGKVRLASTPWVNHSWHATLYVTSRGLTTSLIQRGDTAFQMDFDLIDHRLEVSRSDGRRSELRLYPRSVADFHGELMARLAEIDLVVHIHGAPNEVADPVPFKEDFAERAYDSKRANLFWRALSSSAGVLGDFRGEFRGKCSPVHFFWGGFDLAVTRFSGRRAPTHQGGIPNLPDWVTREAYSHEVSSAGFWPGGDAYPQAMFYSYAYPSPTGYADHDVRPGAAAWNSELGEFVLPYEAVRTSPDPRGTLMEFLRSTYAAAATLGKWDRGLLEWGSDARPARESR